MADTPLKPIPAAPKKLVLCCDGTWQSSVSGKHNLPSNITRIARTIAKAGRDTDGRDWQQLVYYDAGVGTGSLTKIESDRQGATGDGLIVNVLEAYNFVVNNYSPGDKIYCFGFSRGAFTARAIAGMITDFGVIKPENMKHFATLLAAYQTNLNKNTFRRTKEYFEWYAGKAPLVPESQKETVYPKIPWYDTGKGPIEWENSRSIEVVGVFDTVGSLGMADTYLRSHADSRREFEWLNVKWSPYIKHAFHALALDDRRQPFLPTLYYIPNEDVIKAEQVSMQGDEKDWPELTEHRARIDAELAEVRKSRKPDLVQVWFTGVHINVGGGTDDAKTDLEGLANITFAWMVELCKPYLAFEEFTNATIANYVQRMVEDVDEQTKGTWQDAPGMVNKAVGAVTGAFSSAGKWVGSFFSSSPDPKKTASGEKLVRSYCYSVIANPPYKPEHWALFRAQDSYTLMYQAMSSPETRRPGASDDRSTEKHFDLKLLGETNEYIHPSVQWRMEQSRINDDKEFQYKSEALNGFVYDKRDGVAGWYKKDGNIWIQEWAIKGALQDEDPSKYDENAEMALIDQCLDKDEVRKFLKSHTVAWQKTQKPAPKPKK